MGGYSGKQFPPGLEPGGELKIWVPNIRRHLLVRNAPGEAQTIQYKGVSLLNYTVAPSVFEPSAFNAEAYDMADTPPGMLSLRPLERRVCSRA